MSTRPTTGTKALRARHGVEHQEEAGEHQRGTHVLLQEEERQRERDAYQHRQRVFHGRDIEMAGEPRRAMRRVSCA